MKALVTGGAGFIGSNLVREWLARGHEAVVLDNLSSGYASNLLPAVPFVEGDIRDLSAVERAISGCAVVFHLAASVGNKRAIDDPLTDSAINVLGTLQVLEAARRHGIRRVVYSSSAATYGELKTLPLAEDHPQEPDSPYGVSKLAGEKHCLAYNRLYGTANVCLRYFNVYGPLQRYDAYGNVIPIFGTRILAGQPLTIFGDGGQTRDFVHVRDVVAANLAAALSPTAAGAFNVGSGRQTGIRSLAEQMLTIAGVDAPIVHDPPRPGDVRHSLADIAAAGQAFGYRPSVSLATGLHEYWAWLTSAAEN